MASPAPERTTPRAISESTNATTYNNSTDQDLLQNLHKLSITSLPNTKPSVRHSPSIDRLSSASPNARVPRSPISRSNSNSDVSRTRSSTPTLLRKASTTSLRSSNGITPTRPPSRRNSSTPFLSPTAAKSPLSGSAHNMEPLKEKPAPTAISVASAYFAEELSKLHSSATDQSSETVVILHDACYGHRYSRPRTSKGTLSTIVERPERIQASVLGVSMAYVRLGERHCEGKHPIHPDLDPSTLPSIPFRIHKTDRKLALNSTAVTNVHGTKWMEELKRMCDDAESKLALNGSELRRPEMNRGPDAEPPQKLHEGDLYLCSESLGAFEGALGAVCEAVDQIFAPSPHKRAFVAVRPPGHHCSASHPSGFCWVNNVHVGIMHGILNHGLTHAAIIDFDLHHGDGSQSIAWQHNKRSLPKAAAAWKKTSIGYFSLHDINSYPCEYGDEDKVRNASLCIENAHGQNIWNVHLQEWKSDVEFWKLYQSRYSVLLDKTRNYLRQQTERYRAHGQVPRAAIFLSAGFDASEWEGAGMQRHKVNVPTEFYARLTRDVVKLASEEGLSVDGRVISILEGGYSDRALYASVLSHLGGLAGNEPLVSKDESSNGFGSEMNSRVSSIGRRSLGENEFRSLKAAGFPYDPHWWSASELDRLDSAMIAPPPEPKFTRTVTAGNYSSPTQSSTLKIAEVARIRRSVSGHLASQTFVPRPPTPPPPDVPWPAASHALSRLLIPNNRQINSCKHEELNAEATRARRDRQSLVIGTNDRSTDSTITASAPAPAPTRMSLRERKPVKPSYVEEDEDIKSRRKTVGGSTILASDKATARGIPTQAAGRHSRQPSRRLSVSSTLTVGPDESSDRTQFGYRPDTSQSIRPESSMSVRTQASNVLNVKKTRPTAPPRKDSGRAPRAPRKTKATVPKAEPSLATTGTTNGKPAKSPKKEPSGAITPTSMNDLDDITASMKKIKINVLTKEEKEARRKAEAERKLAADEKTFGGPSVPSEMEIENQPIEDTQVPPSKVEPNDQAQRLPELPRQQLQPIRLDGPFENNESYTTKEAKMEDLSLLLPTITTPTEPSPSCTPLGPSSPAIQGTPHPAQNEDLFIQYQPDGPPPATIPFSGPVQILEPNTGTPAKPNNVPTKPPLLHQERHRLPPFGGASIPNSPARKGGHGFTANSDIPFARHPAPLQDQNPRALTPASAGNDAANPEAPQLSTMTPPEVQQRLDRDIWKIPETPEHSR